MREIKRKIFNKNKEKSKKGYAQHLLVEAQGLFRAGKFRAAELACNEILINNPRNANVLSLLGSIALVTGNNRATLDLGRRAVAINPSDENTHINMGIASYNLQDYDGAIVLYLKALTINRNNSLTYYNLGNAYKMKEDYESAIRAYREAIRLKPDYFKAYNNLGNVYTSVGNLDNAINCFKKTVELCPSIVEAYNNLGSNYFTVGELESAKNSFNKTLEIKPGDHVALAGLAGIYTKKRDYDKAYAIIAPLLKGDASNVNAHVLSQYAVVCQRIDKQHEAVDIISESLDVGKFTPEEQRFLHFSLGNLYDDLEKYADAFDHYSKGNELKKVHFSHKKNWKRFQSIIDLYSSDVPRSTSTVMSRLPVFIVGMPRSGTSLVEQILASHPNVHGAGELNDIPQLVGRLPGLSATAITYPESEKLISKDQLNRFAKEYLETLVERAGNINVSRVTDKMPVNFEYLGLIKRLLPHATIIHCIRDPLDTCISCYFQNFAGWLPYTYDLETLGTVYRQYEYLMRFWQVEMRIPVLEIRYEELVNNQELLSRKLIEYCGLEWDDRCLEFYKTERIVHTASVFQVRQPIYTKSVERWKNYEKYIGPLRVGLGKQLY